MEQGMLHLERSTSETWPMEKKGDHSTSTEAHYIKKNIKKEQKKKQSQLITR